MQNFKSYFISQLAHLLLSNLAKRAHDLLHEGQHWLPILIHLILVLLSQTEKSDATGQYALFIAGLQSI